MNNRPRRSTKHNDSKVYEEAESRDLISKGAGGNVWFYQFHDTYGIAHFYHLHQRAYLQMLPVNENQGDT